MASVNQPMLHALHQEFGHSTRFYMCCGHRQDSTEVQEPRDTMQGGAWFCTINLYVFSDGFLACTKKKLLELSLPLPGETHNHNSLTKRLLCHWW